MKKFKLTITISEFVLYQATFTFDKEQYDKILSSYSPGKGYEQGHIIQNITQQEFDRNKDYAKEAPDAVVAMLICEEVSYPFDSDFCLGRHYNPLESDQASIQVDVDEFQMVDWECVPIE